MLCYLYRGPLCIIITGPPSVLSMGTPVYYRCLLCIIIQGPPVYYIITGPPSKDMLSMGPPVYTTVPPNTGGPVYILQGPPLLYCSAVYPQCIYRLCIYRLSHFLPVIPSLCSSPSLQSSAACRVPRVRACLQEQQGPQRPHATARGLRLDQEGASMSL